LKHEQLSLFHSNSCLTDLDFILIAALQISQGYVSFHCKKPSTTAFPAKCTVCINTKST